MKLALDTSNQNTNILRTDTIHKVKGEGVDAVLVVGSEDFFDDVVNSVEANEDTEQRRLCYVAMTRAKHLLVVATPIAHYLKRKNFWAARHFQPGN
jgi:superfamily I DNA/RNA helicase